MGITCGSYALKGATVDRDASYVQRLRKAGIIILGTTNLSQWRNNRGSDTSGFRKTTSSNGWSAVGGQTIGGYYPKQDPIGSSSGSAVATALGLAFAAIGTEVNGSIAEPSHRANIVGIKPTVGLTSRDLVSITRRQGSVGPLARTLEDAASLLEVIAGKCSHDSDTQEIPFETIPEYSKCCNKSVLKGARIGIPRNAFEDIHGRSVDAIERAALVKAISLMKDAGAEIIDPADYPEYAAFLAECGPLRARVACADWKAELAQFVQNLAHNPHGINNIDDLVASYEIVSGRGLPVQRCDGFRSHKGLAQDDPQADEAWKRLRELAFDGGIAGAMKLHNLDALLLPTALTPFVCSVARVPIITVPMGFYPADTDIVWNGRGNLVLMDKNLPFGLAFTGLPFTEEKLVGYAYALEQLTKARDQVDPIVLPKTELQDVVGKDLTE